MNARLSAITIAPGASVREALEAIDRGGVGLALVTEEGSLVGTLTDGDVRRAILGGAGLGDCIADFANTDFTTVGPETDRSWVLDLMQARSLRDIPVVDDQGRLVGLHVLGELISATPRPESAVIMAGGRGRRLQPLTQSQPKPMLSVAGRPIIERIVLHLVGSGFERVFISVSYLAERIEDHFGSGDRFGCQIEYLREDPVEPLGTAGALGLLPGEVRFGELPVLVMNGDLLTQFSPSAMLERHSTDANVMTLGSYEYFHEVPFGVIDTDGRRLVSLREKPTQGWRVSAGIYCVAPTVLQRIEPTAPLDMTDVVAECLRRDEPIGIFDIEEEWLDVGRASELRRARGTTT